MQRVAHQITRFDGSRALKAYAGARSLDDWCINDSSDRDLDNCTSPFFFSIVRKW